ncbi:MAG: hypothetical protein KKC20_06980 [Proteobacteria bacterium]|nr:hypothetical protein [Pseudomonadota bacterium]
MFDPKRFMETHVDYVMKNQIDVMVKTQYTEDAVLLSPFPCMEAPPPYVIRGNDAVRDFYHKYNAWQGFFEIERVYNQILAEDAISFQTVVRTQTGRWASGISWRICDGRISHHFSFGYRLDPPED